ncbi:hypothetical protein K466DRAFT_632990 [Polyporus arcularius HHB13444]|uniref:Uncharacterized protein n=1 Tax=Polyporus arcularius HHB13444 TaxID=1314778 RepID=A0A5C3NZY5_9APHY|nr:hypothetical protein K466DRAFT_632990 [Polyporus arcularius HHB13444]
MSSSKFETLVHLRDSPSYSVDDLLLILHALLPAEERSRVITKSINAGSKPEQRWLTFMNAIATVAAFHPLCDTAAVSVLNPEPEDLAGSADILLSCRCENGSVETPERDIAVLLDRIRPFESLRRPSSDEDDMDPTFNIYYATWSMLMEHVWAFARTKVARNVALDGRLNQTIASLDSFLLGRASDSVCDSQIEEGDNEGKGKPRDEQHMGAITVTSAIRQIHGCLSRLVTLSDHEVYFYEALEIDGLLKEKKVQELIEQAGGSVPGSYTFLRDDVLSLANAVSHLVRLALNYRRITKNQALPAWNVKVVTAQPARRFEAELTDEIIRVFLNTLACISLPQHEFSQRAHDEMLKRLRKRHDRNSLLFPRSVLESHQRDDGPVLSHCEAALICHLAQRGDRSRAKAYIGVSAPSCQACRLFLEAFNERYSMNLHFDRLQRSLVLLWHSPPMSADLEDTFRKHLECEVQPLLSNFAEDGLRGDLYGEITPDLFQRAIGK